MKTKYRYNRNRYFYSRYVDGNGGHLETNISCEVCAAKLKSYETIFIYVYGKFYCEDCICELEKTEADWAVGLVAKDSYELIKI